MEKLFVFLVFSLSILMLLVYINLMYKHSDYYKTSLCERVGGTVMIDEHFDIYCEHKNRE